ncbi:MAG TPA: chemotaxis protein CheW [Nostocaceae cyanobacterium]|nr:chemotaxis protein CheW [Nostocaceae cyanobacterium]
MASTSYRRFRKKSQIETHIPTHKLICFQLGREQYAISIFQVLYIIKTFTTQGILNSGHSLVSYNDEIITQINISGFFLDGDQEKEYNYLIVCTTKTGERIGIPVANIPTVLEVGEDRFSDLPTTHQQEIGTKGIEKLINTSDQVTLFYLNIDQLHIFLFSPSGNEKIMP